MAFVAILMGSDSDLPLVENTLNVLKSFDIAYEVKVASAHRTPDVVATYVADAERRGCQVFICAAGLAAHLAGAVAARTLRPVIGIPVATVAVGKAGARNAGYLAAQIMAVADPSLFEKVKAEREQAARAVIARDEALAAKLAK